MKFLKIIALLVCLGITIPAHAEETSRPLPAEGLDWSFTLAVEKDSEKFSLSLMKEGWLAFDTWGDEKELDEVRIDLSKDEFENMERKFRDLFKVIQKSKAKNTDEEPSNAFEKVGALVTTLEFSGKRPEVTKFFNELSSIFQLNFPFPIGKEEQGGGGETCTTDWE